MESSIHMWNNNAALWKYISTLNKISTWHMLYRSSRPFAPLTSRSHLVPALFEINPQALIINFIGGLLAGILHLRAREREEMLVRPRPP
jgi:hypothetical protein